ncbi:MAG: hypothetical protein ACR2G7_13990 [Acidimicrobiales bacterium]
MAQRTIADATFALETAAGLSDADRRTAQGEIEEAKRLAATSANELADARVVEVAELRDEALRELCDVRDAYAELINAAEIGRITAAECDRALNDLRARQRTAERTISRTSEALTFVEAVEADPVAYGDAICAKYPLIRPTFSF